MKEIYASKTNVLNIGFMGEDNRTRVHFPIADLQAEYPGCAFALLIKRAGDNGVYVVEPVISGDEALWTVEDGFLANKGEGEAVLICSTGTVTAKRKAWKTWTDYSLSGGVTPPADFSTWVTELLQAGADVQAAVDAFNEITAEATEGEQTSAYIDRTGDHPVLKITIRSGGGGDVQSVNGKTGVVVLGASDVHALPDSTSIPVVDSDLSGTSTNAIQNKVVKNALDQKANSTTVSQLSETIVQLPNVKDSTESDPDIDVSDESGNVIVRLENGGIKTKEFDSAAAGQVKESTTSGIDVDFSDPNGNVIMRLTGGHIKTKNFDSSNVGSGIIARNKSLIDGVYAACRWHQPSLSSKQFCILIGGDSHGDDVRMNSMVDFLNGVDALDAAIMLGDMSGNVFSDSISYYTDALANAEKPFLTVIGNHDVVGASSDADLYTKYSPCLPYADLASGEAVANKLYYYKDFASYKIRVIVLMQYDYTYTGNLCFGQDQIDWLISTLNSTPSDYGVIIAEHTNPSRYMTYNMDEKYTSSTWVQSNYAPTDMDGDPVPDIVDAWINGTTLSETYSYTFTGAPSALSVSADFTSRGEGEFITYLGGHWHMPVLGYVTGHTDQPDWHMDAAGMIHSTQGDTPRKEGTVSEDSFCALAVDRDKKTVKVFRVGAHFTKDAVDRQYFKYSYGGV